MEKIGVIGTSTIFELGYPDDIDLFFMTVSKVLEQGQWGKYYPVKMLELYRKTLDINAMNKAKIELDEIKLKFSYECLNSAFFSKLNVDINKTTWDIHATNISSFFDGFFKAFNTAYSMTLSLNDKYGEYSPMFLGRTSIRYATEDIMRSPDEYDKLSDADLPFWKK